ncbi:MAG: hypothetical protein LBK53_06025 [Heliobacteriaceae bacterium]|jgi:hypothetical protein|nr:hypothetical protein [Heliobacteriaceae bacterium]
MKINSTNNQNFGAYFVTVKSRERNELPRYVKGVNPDMMEHLEKEGLADEFKAAEAKLAKLPDVPLCIDTSAATADGTTYYLKGFWQYKVFIEKITKSPSKGYGQQFVDLTNNICNSSSKEHKNFMLYAGGKNYFDNRASFEQFKKELVSNGFVIGSSLA